VWQQLCATTDPGFTPPPNLGTPCLLKILFTPAAASARWHAYYLLATISKTLFGISLQMHSFLVIGTDPKYLLNLVYDVTMATEHDGVLKPGRRQIKLV
jgi:hypothetical protein